MMAHTLLKSRLVISVVEDGVDFRKILCQFIDISTVPQNIYRRLLRNQAQIPLFLLIFQFCHLVAPEKISRLVFDIFRIFLQRVALMIQRIYLIFVIKTGHFKIGVPSVQWLLLTRFLQFVGCLQLGDSTYSCPIS